MKQNINTRGPGWLPRRRGLVAAAALLFAGAVGAQTSGAMSAADWAKVVAAAKTEGKVVLYTQTFPGLNTRLKADFEKANPGIVLEYSRIVAAAIITKLEQERQSGADGADIVVSADAPFMQEWGKQNYLKPLVNPNVAKWPKEQLLSNRTVAVLALEPLVTAYNTTLVGKPLTSLADVMRPEFRGKIITQEAIGVSSLAWYEWAEKTNGKDFLNRLATLKPQFASASAATTQAVAAGEAAVVLFTVPTTVIDLAAKGAPIKLFTPPHVPSTRYSAGILAKAKRPNAAMVLLDYLMSTRGQTVWSGDGSAASPLPGIPGSLNVNEVDPMPDYSPADRDAYRAKWDKIFKGN